MNKTARAKGKRKSPALLPGLRRAARAGCSVLPGLRQRTGKKPSQTAERRSAPGGGWRPAGAAVALALAFALILLLGGEGGSFVLSGELWGSLSGEEHILFDRERGLALLRQ